MNEQLYNIGDEVLVGRTDEGQPISKFIAGVRYDESPNGTKSNFSYIFVDDVVTVEMRPVLTEAGEVEQEVEVTNQETTELKQEEVQDVQQA